MVDSIHGSVHIIAAMCCLDFGFVVAVVWREKIAPEKIFAELLVSDCRPSQLALVAPQ
jgi:hypothetical protein